MNNDNKNLQESMAHLAEATVFTFKRLGIKLDYSVESLQVVEEELDLLAECIKEISDREAKEDQITNIGSAIGAYFGEVIIRTLGGEWKRDSNGLAVDFCEDASAYTVNMVKKRLAHGESENIYFKFCAICSLVKDPEQILKLVPVPQDRNFLH